MPELPSGYEWKTVELRRGAAVYPNQWKEVVSVDRTITLYVQVPLGEPVVRKKVSTVHPNTTA